MKYLFLIVPLFTTFLLFGQSSDTISVFFDHNSSLPKYANNDGIKSLRELSGSGRIIIEGYTDTSGTEDYNKELAARRTESIRGYISIPDTQIVLKPIGETSQFGSDKQNRRVMVIQESVKTVDTLVLGIQFRNRQAVILEKSYPELRKLIETIKRGSYSKIEVHGHVCCTGNYQLSYDRAKTVEKELIKAGIEPAKIHCTGHSNHQPRYPEINAENEALNRRVEVVLIE